MTRGEGPIFRNVQEIMENMISFPMALTEWGEAKGKIRMLSVGRTSESEKKGVL